MNLGDPYHSDNGIGYIQELRNNRIKSIISNIKSYHPKAPTSRLIDTRFQDQRTILKLRDGPWFYRNLQYGN